MSSVPPVCRMYCWRSASWVRPICGATGFGVAPAYLLASPCPVSSSAPAFCSTTTTCPARFTTTKSASPNMECAAVESDQWTEWYTV